MIHFIDRLHRSRLAILLATICLVALCGVSLTKLEVEMDLLAQLPSGSAVFRDYRDILSRFGTTDTLVILVTGPVEDVSQFGEELVKKLRRINGVSSVRSGLDPRVLRDDWLVPHRWQLLDEAGYDQLERRLGAVAMRERIVGLRRALAFPGTGGVAAMIASDPLGVDGLVGESIRRRYGDPLFSSATGQFLSADGKALLVLVRTERSAFDTVFGRQFLAEVTAAEDSLLEEGWHNRGLSVGHTGAIVYALGDRSVLERDLNLYFLIAPLAVLALFHGGLRTFRILPFVTVPLLVTTAVTFALSLLLFGRLTMISVAFAGIFYGLGVDSSIYFYATLRKRVVSDAESLRIALAETLTEIGPANVIASVTTAAAFFVIGFSGFDGVAQLGVLTGVAMLLNMAATFVLLPAMTLWWGPSAVPSFLSEQSRTAMLVSPLAALRSVRYPIAVGLGLIVLLGLPRLSLDTDLSNLHPGQHEAVEVETEIQRYFGEVDTSALLAHRSGTLDEGLIRAEEISTELARLSEEGAVSSWSTITAFVPPADVVARRLARWQELPRTEVVNRLRHELTAAGFDANAFEGFFKSLTEVPPELDPADPVLVPLIERHLDHEQGAVWAATRFLAHAPLEDVVSALRARLPAGDLRVLGQPLIEREFHRLLRYEVVGFLAAAVFLNAIFLFFFARRVGEALRLFLPAGAALAVTLGWMGLSGVALNPINIVALPVILGLGVDGTVYLAAHGREDLMRGIGPLLLASGTTFLGFGLLAFSHFPALSTLGTVAGVGLVLSTLFTLLLAPPVESLR